MRKAAAFTLLVGALFPSLLAGGTGPLGGTRPTVVFADLRHGLAAGAGGIVRTIDGGRTWRRVSPLRTSALDVVASGTAFALVNGAVYRAADGRRWRLVSTPGLVALEAIDERRGYGLDGQGRLWRTLDGGSRWRRLPAPSRLQAVCATVAGAWIARGPLVWRRAGGGWRLALRARLYRGGERPSSELGCRGRAVWALVRRGVAAGSEGYDVFRSLDGGRTWRAVLANLDPLRPRLPRIAAQAGPFAVLGEGGAVFLGWCPACGWGAILLVATGDGGRSWRRSTPLRGYAPVAAAFVDARHGWLLTTSRPGSAPSGLLWSTVDGGRRFRLVLRSPALGLSPP